MADDEWTGRHVDGGRLVNYQGGLVFGFSALIFVLCSLSGDSPAVEAKIKALSTKLKALRGSCPLEILLCGIVVDSFEFDIKRSVVSLNAGGNRNVAFVI